MPARRTYRCEDCGHEFTHLHMDSGESFAGADCPKCAEGKTAWQPGSFSISSAKSRAVDYVHKAVEQDYGMTDMGDNLRAGDTVVKGPVPVQTAEADAMVREYVQAGMPAELAPGQKEAVQSFWQTGGKQQPVVNNPIAAAVARGVATAPAGAAQARAEGLDPISLLHKAKPAIKMNVAARA